MGSSKYFTQLCYCSFSAWDTFQPDGLGLVMVPFAVVSSDGSLLWIPLARTKSTCVADVTFFPFDEQECILKLGSWTYDGVHLDLDFFDDIAEIDLNDYTESEQWHIIGHPGKRNVKYYPCCEEPYPRHRFQAQTKAKVLVWIFADCTWFLIIVSCSHDLLDTCG